MVRRSDHSIVDGHYRYLAASQLGHSHIDCVYFEGGGDSAFLEALRCNRDHGLPLSRRDREAAARQVLGLHPEWSDRRIGETCGLAPGTIARLRPTAECSSDQAGRLNVRLGRDGRRRPVDPQASRERIVHALRAEPERSLRDIARRTGTSPATVRAVKARHDQMADDFGASVANGTPAASPPVSWISDAALHSTAEADAFAEWFRLTDITDEWRTHVHAIPISRVYEVADEARRRAAEWLAVASVVEERVRGRHSGRRSVGA